MKLRKAFARFYRSFNFDHARKLSGGVEPQPWEIFRDVFYPYVEVDIDSKITTVVGANESGKSHLLGAVNKAITGVDIARSDLCRYSPFFGVAKGQTCWPHVGVGWDRVSSEESAAIAGALGIAGVTFNQFLMFREEPQGLTVWLPGNGGVWTAHRPDAAQIAGMVKLLPKPFEIKADVALPDAIPFEFLNKGDSASAAAMSRASNQHFTDHLEQIRGLVGASPAQIQQNAPQLFTLLQPFMRTAAETESPNHLASLALGRRLLLELGRVDPSGLEELAGAIDRGQAGYAGGLLRGVNEQLERQLNFRRYWVQDRDFNLRVSTRDRELVFTVSDRTGTEYSFSERSSGLRYFLSYLIQAQVHRPQADRQSILLMDEPDTYLSAEAQQDLMRLFRDLADPVNGGDPLQVVYVTHSPFLLDKNHSERIRVLEKGTGYDGTRVVPSVSRNHYEPLRSAFGAFVGETAFVGSMNLLVEGAADQVILAGAAGETRRRRPGVEDDTLDLNRMVIVPCGSAGEVPYTVFRVRGQGADKPPVVVLLDADEAGRIAANQLCTDSRLKKLITKDLVLNLALIGVGVEGYPQGDIEIEDLVPLPLATAAVAEVLSEIGKFREGEVPTIAANDIENQLKVNGKLMEAIGRAATPVNARIEKLAFAKALVRVVENDPPGLKDEIALYLERMCTVFRAVNKARRAAERASGTQKLSALMDQRARLFKIDHPERSTKEEARIVLDEIEEQLDESVEAEAIRNAVLSLRREHDLHDDPAAPLGAHLAFIDGLMGLKHALRVQSAEGASALRAKTVREAPVQEPAFVEPSAASPVKNAAITPSADEATAP